MPVKRKTPNANTRTRNYKEIYAKYHSSAKRRKYRSDLGKARRKAGKKAKGKDILHGKDGKIKGLGSRKANRRDGQRKSVASRRRNKGRR